MMNSTEQTDGMKVTKQSKNVEKYEVDKRSFTKTHERFNKIRESENSNDWRASHPNQTVI